MNLFIIVTAVVYIGVLPRHICLSNFLPTYHGGGEGTDACGQDALWG